MLGDVADHCAGLRLTMNLETGQETADTLLAVLQKVDRPNLGVNFDPANMILYGMGDPVEALRRLAGAGKQIHVKDALPARTPGAWGTEVVAGRGAVDWQAFFDVARSISPAVSFVIERESSADHLADVAAARDLIEKHL